MYTLYKYLWALLAVICLPMLLAAQTMSLNGHQFEKQNGKWYQLEQGIKYEVNPTIITVKFTSSADSSQRANLHRIHDAQVLRRNTLGYVDIKLPSGANPVSEAQAYMDNPLVDVAVVNTYGEYINTPNDPNFDDQWFHERIQSTDAWDHETGDNSVIVGVLDSGTEYDHEDLAGNIWVNPAEDYNNNGLPDYYPYYSGGDLDNYDNDGNGKVDDLAGWDFSNDDNDVTGPYYHGTHVAGIVAAETNNSTGVAGVSGGWGSQPGVSLLIGGVGDSYPDGSVLDDAILYAAASGADVITMSLSVGQNAAIESAINSAHNDGVFIDCASGNSDASSVSFPAYAGNVMAVGATDTADLRVTIPPYNWGSNYGDSLDVVAPGLDIESTQLNDSYGSGSGTSFAAPQIAGIAALLRTLDPNFTPTEIEEIIARSAEKVRTDVYSYNQNRRFGAWNNQMGYGRVNAYYAIAPPSAPQNISLSGGSGDHPTISWSTNPEPYVKSYRIYRNVRWDRYTQTGWQYQGSTSQTNWTDQNFLIGSQIATAYYKVKARDYSNQNSPYSGTVSVDGAPGMSKDQQFETASIDAIPETYGVSDNYPNPFNPSTTIHYQLPVQSQVRIAVYTVTGSKVMDLVQSEQSPGYYSVTWHGTNMNGQQVATGVYLYHVSIQSQESGESYNRTHKMLLVK